jgi:hypothetical protein
MRVIMGPEQGPFYCIDPGREPPVSPSENLFAAVNSSLIGEFNLATRGSGTGVIGWGIGAGQNPVASVNCRPISCAADPL